MRLTDQERKRLLLAAAVKARQIKSEEEARRAQLDNLEDYISGWCGLNVSEQGDGFPYFDLNNPESPYALMWWFLNNNNGHFKFLVAGRRTGKTKLIAAYLLRQQLLDPDRTLFVGGESTDRGIERVEWMLGVYERLEAKGYGQYRTKKWSKDSFTIQRPKGKGGDPTVRCGGPEKGLAGVHPDDIWLDDIVGENAFASLILQRDTVSWVCNKIMFWMGPATRMIVSGTMWPGAEHFYRYIYEKVEGKPRLKEIAHGAWYHEGKTYDILSFDSGYRSGKGTKAVFPCLPLPFLAKQFAHNPPMARAQYDNAMLDDIDSLFGHEHIHRDRVAKPLPEGVPVRVYMVTDTSSTQNPGYHSSITAFAIVALTETDDAYVLYLRAGPFNTDEGPGILLDMLDVCKNNRKLDVETVWFETNGPGRIYPSLIRKEAEIRGRQLPFIGEIARNSADTHQRIMGYLAGPVRQGKLRFDPTTVDPDMIDWDPDTGNARGLVADEALTISKHAAGKKPDVFDALSDIWAFTREGIRMCEPPGGAEKKDQPKPGYTEPFFKSERERWDRDHGTYEVIE